MLVNELSKQILGVVQAVVSAPAAFCVIARDDRAARTASGWASVGGVVAPICDREIAALVSAAPISGARACSVALAGHDRLSVVAFEIQAMRVYAGVAWRGDAEREPDELRRLCDLVPVAAQLGALRTQCFEHERREEVLRALRSMTDACCVIDLEARRVRWVYEPCDGAPCVGDLYLDEARFAALAERFHQASVDAAVPEAMAIGRLAIVRTADLGRPEAWGGGPCLAVALRYVAGEATPLSPRERQIAQLLVKGYSMVNASTLLSLSENTIRTYVRRLYRKLEISNRADLTRKCTELRLGVL
ncbi:MAG TPA: helix-turn-helix transcriptional regulator [Kofleriaceae bacterium]|nr:helix-turn-helix transcriptional regulator [Kofleriaceae bacterium]